MHTKAYDYRLKKKRRIENMKIQHIEKNMKKLTKVEPEDPKEGMFMENIEGEKDAPDLTAPEFRIKASYLQTCGSLHLQLGHPNPAEIHKLMEEEIGTPFAQTGSDRVLRKYGIAFNIPTANGSIDQHEMMELGRRLQESDALIVSFASETQDYVTMEFIGVVDGKDNREKDVKMLEFRLGDGETLFVAFSHLKPLGKHKNENYPCIRQEWLLAWLCSNFMEVVEDGE